MNQINTINLVNNAFEDAIHDYKNHHEDMEIEADAAKEVISALDTMQQVITESLFEELEELK
jgi:hypothetical protein